MRILVTGGAGYIGSTVARNFYTAGHEVQVLDSLSLGNRKACPGMVLHHGTIEDLGIVCDVMESFDPEVLVHCAALASVPESYENPVDYWDVNYEGTKNLLALKGKSLHSVLFSSTAAVYDMFDTRIIHPRTPYGKSKLAAEHFIQDYCERYGLKAFIFRYYNAAGAEEDGSHGEDRQHETHLIPVVLDRAMKREPVQVYGTNLTTRDGTCIRDYVSVLDIHNAHVKALNYLQEKDPGKWNVGVLGSGCGFSVKEVIKEASEVTGLKIEIEECPKRPGDPDVLIADPGTTEMTLGWKAQRSLNSIMKSAWAWKKSHPKGYAT